MDQKRTKVVAVVLAVVLAVGGIAAGISALGGSAAGPPAGPRSQADADADPGAGEEAESVEAPYAPGTACPDPLPNPASAGLEVPNLANAASVRLCGTDAATVPTDALVTGLGAFARAVDGLPAADTDLCEAAGSGAPSTVLVAVMDDGREITMRTGACAGLLSGRTTVSGLGVETAFLDALDQQRSDGSYTPPAAAAEADISCDQAPTTAPVTPGRESVTAAVLCPSPDAEAEPLDAATLQTLTTAWDAAPAPQANSCDLTDGPQGGFVQLRTDLGDVVRLLPGCDGLVLGSSDLEGSGDIDFVVPLTSVVPVTLADLGG